MKRDIRLRGLSSDHHQALVIARRLTRDAAAWTEDDGAELARRFEQELEPHFRLEEEVLLPALRTAGGGELATRTLDDHTALRALLVSARTGDGGAARDLGERLGAHVQFEERELFPACEARLPAAVLDEIGRRAPWKA